MQLSSQQNIDIQIAETSMAKLSVGNDKTALNVDDFRSCRSNSLYTRCGNEALAALRHRFAHNDF